VRGVLGKLVGEGEEAFLARGTYIENDGLPPSRKRGRVDRHGKQPVLFQKRRDGIPWGTGKRWSSHQKIRPESNEEARTPSQGKKKVSHDRGKKKKVCATGNTKVSIRKASRPQGRALTKKGDKISLAAAGVTAKSDRTFACLEKGFEHSKIRRGLC